MCGILGIYNLDGKSVNSEILHTMGQNIAHRGPDGEGQFVQNNIGLLHKRLAILDPSDKGKQPMISKDGQWVLVFNGCIYNFKELRNELTIKGYKFLFIAFCLIMSFTAFKVSSLLVIIKIFSLSNSTEVSVPFKS